MEWRDGGGGGGGEREKNGEAKKKTVGKVEKSNIEHDTTITML